MSAEQQGASGAPPSGDRGAGLGKSLGAGNEAAQGVHAAQQGGAPAAPDAQAQAETGRGADAAGTDRSGSEPLERKREHVPGYGGRGGAPRTSSDTREPRDPEGDG